MKVITAVEQYKPESKDVTVFLGGGITGCRDWQNDVIKKLSGHEKDLSNLVILNPRRSNFPINDPSASQQQIEWEYKYLMDCDIFSMFFVQDTESDQPICMYELGRYIPIKINQNKSIVITSEPNYKRIKDVEIQCKLAFNDNNYQINNDLNQHVDAIIECYNKLNNNSNKYPSKDIEDVYNLSDVKIFNTIGNKTITESSSITTLLNLNLHKYKNIDNTNLLFENKLFVNCDFSDSTLYNIKYKNCNFLKCNFNRSDLKDVVFENCELGKTSFINTKGKYFKNCKMIQCEEVENTDLNFDFISKFLDQDQRFSKIEEGVYSVKIPEYSMLNILIMKNDEISSDPKNPHCDIATYITPVSEDIKQITPLFTTYDFNTVSNLFKADDFCNNLISDIIQNIKLKYTPVLKSAIEQLKKITDGEK